MVWNNLRVGGWVRSTLWLAGCVVRGAPARLEVGPETVGGACQACCYDCPCAR